MTVGRLTGDRVVQRFGTAAVLRGSALLAAAGLGFGLLVGEATAAVAGFGCMGLGLANTVPILFGAAGRTPGVPPAQGLAAVTTAGYFGFLAGPPLIGVAADLVSLPLALGLVVFFLTLTALFARVVRRPSVRSDG
jgi:hypothetical protein